MLRAYLNRDLPRNQWDVWIMEEGRGPGGEQSKRIADPLELRESESLGESRGPCFSLEPEAAQAFLDELWACGFRPTHAPSGDDLMAAKDAHIHDLRSSHIALIGVAERRTTDRKQT